MVDRIIRRAALLEAGDVVEKIYVGGLKLKVRRVHRYTDRDAVLISFTNDTEEVVAYGHAIRARRAVRSTAWYANETSSMVIRNDGTVRMGISVTRGRLSKPEADALRREIAATLLLALNAVHGGGV